MFAVEGYYNEARSLNIQLKIHYFVEFIKQK